MIKMKRLIVVCLFGGLGNQLFQLSYAHKLSKEFDCRVFVFFLHAESKKNDRFLTSFFRECRHLRQLGSIPTIFFRFTIFIKKFDQTKISFLSKIINACLSVFFSIRIGYFQELKNVLPLDEVFLGELERSIEDKQLLLNLEKCVVVHQRIGDFQNHMETYGLLTPDYFEKSVDLLVGRLDLNNVILFSDSPEKAIKSLRACTEISIMDPDIFQAPNVLATISKAKHIVISNSTLSWWGAILAKQNGANVICPQKWNKNLSSDFELINQKVGFVPLGCEYI